MAQTFSTSDVAAHKSKDDLWIIVDEDVYDLTKFQDEHPGGAKILTRVAGKDASKQFWKYHNEGILKKYQSQLQVGSLDSKKITSPPTPPATPPQEAVTPKAEPGTLSVELTSNAIPSEPLDAFGSLIPYGDPNWYQTYHSPVR